MPHGCGKIKTKHFKIIYEQHREIYDKFRGKKSETLGNAGKYWDAAEKPINYVSLEAIAVLISYNRFHITYVFLFCLRFDGITAKSLTESRRMEPSVSQWLLVFIREISLFFLRLLLLPTCTKWPISGVALGKRENGKKAETKPPGHGHLNAHGGHIVPKDISILLPPEIETTCVFVRIASIFFCTPPVIVAYKLRSELFCFFAVSFNPLHPRQTEK